LAVQRALLQTPDGLPGISDIGGGVMLLSDRERRTVLAALDAWMNELGFHSIEELQHYYPALGVEPLTLEEVTALRVRVAAIDDLVSEIANAAQALESTASRVVRAVQRLQRAGEKS
jgi:hypothetical protein